MRRKLLLVVICSCGFVSTIQAFELKKAMEHDVTKVKTSLFGSMSSVRSYKIIQREPTVSGPAQAVRSSASQKPVTLPKPATPQTVHNEGSQSVNVKSPANIPLPCLDLNDLTKLIDMSGYYGVVETRYDVFYDKQNFYLYNKDVWYISVNYKCDYVPLEQSKKLPVNLNKPIESLRELRDSAYSNAIKESKTEKIKPVHVILSLRCLELTRSDKAKKDREKAAIERRKREYRKRLGSGGSGGGDHGD